MNKNIKTIIMSAVLIAVTAVCVFLARMFYSGKNDKIISRSYTQEHFGTIMTITLYGSSEKELDEIIADAFEEIQRLENIFSAKLQTSELSDLNENGFNNPVKVSLELYSVLKEAVEYNKLSDGALDVTIGHLIELWGIGTENARIPSQSELEAYAGMNGCDYLVLDDDTVSVWFTDSRVKLDLGAIAKGYAADVIKIMIIDRNAEIYGLLDFGGNIMTVGSKAEGKPWVIGITDPFNVGSACATVDIIDKCVVTSGNYERYFEKDGQRYHHILDPSTGAPSRSGIVSATIIGGNSMQCDALSTASFIMGCERAIKLIDSIDGVEAVLIDSDGNIYRSKKIDSYNLSFR